METSMQKSTLYITTALMALATPALAQANFNLGADPGTDETVVVSATRVTTPISQIGSSITVITADQIEASQQRDLPSALSTVPGLFVEQTGGLGGQVSLFLRGANSNQTKVIIDGIDVSDPSTPTDVADIGKYLTGDIARVEVLRGPQSGLYGSDSIGGVVNIVTKEGEGPFKLSAQAEGGSFDTFNQSATASGAADGLHYSFTVDHVHAGDTPVTPLSLLLPGEKRHDDYYDGLQLSTKLGYDVADNFDLGFAGHYGNSLGKITGDAFNYVTFVGYPSPTQTRIVTGQYYGRATAHLSLWNGRLDQTIGVGLTDAITSSLDPNNGYSLSKGQRFKLDYQGNVKIVDGETLVVGAETQRETNRRGVSFGFPTGPATGITTNAGYAELQSDFGSGLYDSASIRYDSNSRFGSKVTYHIAPAWLIAATGTKLKASLGTGFDAPALLQLFGGFGANPQLKPETSTGFDAGFEQKLLGDTLSGGATWFRNNIRNLITNGPAPTYLYGNIGRARTQGVETFLDWKAMETLSFRADYTYTDAINALTHVALARRPRNMFAVSGDWQALPDLSLNARLGVTGPQADIGRESGRTEKLAGYTVLNLAASYRFSETWSLFGRIGNATDTSYQSPDGFLRPRIGAFGGIKANL
jgi:vitamin B12 transporter